MGDNSFVSFKFILFFIYYDFSYLVISGKKRYGEDKSITESIDHHEYRLPLHCVDRPS